MQAVSTLVTPVALHSVALAPICDGDLAKLETLVLRSVWRATRLSQAKEIIFSVTPGHRISPACVL